MQSVFGKYRSPSIWWPEDKREHLLNAAAGSYGITGAAATFLKALFVPTDIDGCKLWLRSDLGVTKDAVVDTVSKWADQSLSGNDAVQSIEGNKPLWVDNQLVTHPAIRFNGTSSYMLADGVISSFPLSTTPWSFFLVLKRNRNTDERVLTSSVTSVNRPIYQYAVWDGNCAVRYNSGAVGISQTFADTGTAYHYYVGVFGGSTVNVSKDGTVQLDDASFAPGAFDAPLENFRIGVLEYSSPGNFAGLAGVDLVEVAFYAANISIANRAKLISYAQTRYGL